ncbi:MAG: ribosome silencing factor [Pseudomonadota bacterium]
MPEATDTLLAGVEEALADLKAVNSVTIDVHELSNVMDYLVICTGTSNRHVKSLAENVVKMAKGAGQPPLGVEGQDAGEWVLVDLGDVVVHVMLPATRDFYDLERLWTTVPPAPGSPTEPGGASVDASSGISSDAAAD